MMKLLPEINESAVLDLVRRISDHGIDGVGPLCGARELAAQYNADRSLRTPRERSLSLIKWESSKNFASGFVTGFGGLITLPINVPAALGISWIIQARMAAAIAIFYGWELEDDRVRTLVILSLLGDAGKEVLKRAGIQVGEKLAHKCIMQVPGKVLIEINKKVGFRLLTKAGEKGIINLTKAVPVVGGVIGGTFDAVACNAVGRAAMSIFRQMNETEEAMMEITALARECDELLGFGQST